MSRRVSNLQAGFSMAVILIFIYAVVHSHGADTSGNAPLDWGDIAWFLFYMLIFAFSVIDVYKWFAQLEDD